MPICPAPINAIFLRAITSSDFVAFPELLPRFDAGGKTRSGPFSPFVPARLMPPRMACAPRALRSRRAAPTSLSFGRGTEVAREVEAR